MLLILFNHWSVFGPVKSEWRKFLKMYQIQTHALIITKEEFPSLLAELCEKSFLPSHFKSGFCRSDIHSLNRDAIPSSKLSNLFHLQVNQVVKKMKQDLKLMTIHLAVVNHMIVMCLLICKEQLQQKKVLLLFVCSCVGNLLEYLHLRKRVMGNEWTNEKLSQAFMVKLLPL